MLGQEDPLEEGMATHSSILAWRIPWTESLEGCSPQGRKETELKQLSTRARRGVSRVRPEGWLR